MEDEAVDLSGAGDWQDIPEDLESIVKMATGEGSPPEQEATASETAPEPEKTPDPDPEPEAKAEPETAETETAGDENADGVAARDGKHIIPYDVLDNARKSKTEADKRAAEAEEKTKALEAELEALRTGKSDSEETPVEQGDDGLEEKLKALREEYPEDLMELVEVSVRSAKEARVRATEAEKRVKVLDSAAEQSAKTALQTAIDRNPTLAKWQSGNDEASQALWEAALKLDDALYSKEEWRGKPVDERFSEVVRQLTGNSPSVESDGPDVDKKVDEALKKASSKATPKSMSDLPGSGSAADSSVADRFDRASVHEMSDFLSSKSPDEIYDFLAGLN